jgi:hypothetical protein
VIPPTFTPAATSTPTVTSTPAAPPTAIPTPPFALAPGQGSGGEGNAVGGLFSVPTFITGFASGGNPIYSQRLSFRMFARIDGTANDGDGIDRVEFSITDANGNQVYGRTERASGFCAFGGNDTPGDPCVILELTRATVWPETNNRIQDGPHQIQATVFSNDGLVQNWRVNFEIQRSGSGTGGSTGGGTGGSTGGGTGGTTALVLFDGAPGQSDSFCSRFRSDCNFSGCDSGARIVYGPFCRAGDYPYIQPGLYEVQVAGSGRVIMGATDFGTFQERYAFGQTTQNLPASFRFCWPGRASNGFGFETMVESTGGSPQVTNMKVIYLGSRCE